VTENQFTGADILRIFKEQSNFDLTLDVDIDISKPTAFPTAFTGGGSVPPASVSSTVLAGTVIDSFFFHLDAPTNERGDAAGSVTFDADILAVITNSDTLLNTHTLLGAQGTIYQLTAQNHGTLEDPNDTMTIIGDRTLEFRMAQATGMDQFRVITVVPSPKPDVTGLNDVSGDGVPDVAVLFQRIADRPRVRYYSSVTGRKIKEVSYLGQAWLGIAAATVTNSNGDSVADDPAVALLAHRARDRKYAVECAWPMTGNLSTRFSFWVRIGRSSTWR
jgi:hypothetical protein